MTIKAIRGFRDILPEEAFWWQKVERTAADVCRAFGYKEIRLPLLEATELFARSIGEETDIVEKEMYTFADRHGNNLTLRPEATAGIVRAVIEHDLASHGRPLKLYLIGPMFRYERPQKGRQRQFHQFDVEAFNDPSAQIDAELIVLLDHFLAQLGLKDVVMNINSLGCPEDRPKYRAELQAFLERIKGGLCQDCQRRMYTNPLRVIDCKVPACMELVKDAPSILDSLCSECSRHFDLVQKDLARDKVPFQVNPRLVRGLDYYTRTTFEALAGGLGAQNAVAGGGRYDDLTQTLGGPDIPATGFAVGLERLIMLLSAKDKRPVSDPDLYLAALDEESIAFSGGVAEILRRRGWHVVMDYDAGSLKSKLRRADKIGSARVFILGPEELKSGQGILKDMKKGGQETVPFKDMVDLAEVLAAYFSKEEK